MNCFKAFAIALVEFYKEFVVPSTCKYGKLGRGSYVSPPAIICGSENMYLDDNVRIHGRSHLLAAGGKIIIKRGTGAASDLTIVTSNHRQKIGTERDGKNTDNVYSDVIIDENVWIGANVTILSGVHIGRESIIGAGTVVSKSIPPYTVVVGNPAKIVKMKWSTEDILKHELLVYCESERLSEDEVKTLSKMYSRKCENISAEL